MHFINNDFTSSAENLLKMSNTVPLHVDRIKQMACEVFKIVNILAPTNIRVLITLKNSTSNFRTVNQTTMPQEIRTRYGLKSFHNGAAKIWNSLLNTLRKRNLFLSSVDYSASGKVQLVDVLHALLNTLCMVFK